MSFPKTPQRYTCMIKSRGNERLSYSWIKAACYNRTKKVYAQMKHDNLRLTKVVRMSYNSESEWQAASTLLAGRHLCHDATHDRKRTADGKMAGRVECTKELLQKCKGERDYCNSLGGYYKCSIL